MVYEYGDSLMSLPDESGPLAVSNERYEHGSATASVIFRPVLRLKVTEKNPETANDPVLGTVQGIIAKETDGRTLLKLSGKLPAPAPGRRNHQSLPLRTRKRSLSVGVGHPQTGRGVRLNRPRRWLWRLGGEAQGGEPFLPYRVFMNKKDDREWYFTGSGKCPPREPRKAPTRIEGSVDRFIGFDGDRCRPNSG